MQVSNHQPPTARVARKRGVCQAASQACQHREPEARSGVERAVQGETNQVAGGRVQAVAVVSFLWKPTVRSLSLSVLKRKTS